MLRSRGGKLPETACETDDGAAVTLAVVGGKTILNASALGDDLTVRGTFADGAPALFDRQAGGGLVRVCAFPLGLAYFLPAIPRRPVDRGTEDSSFNPFLPTEFEVAVLEQVLLTLPTAASGRQAVASRPLVDGHLLVAEGIGAAVVLVNWSPTPRHNLTVTVRQQAVPPFESVALASGGQVSVAAAGGGYAFTLSLGVADAIVLR